MWWDTGGGDCPRPEPGGSRTHADDNVVTVEGATVVREGMSLRRDSECKDMARRGEERL